MLNRLISKGHLRFVINLGNPLLAKNHRDGVQGVSVDLAQSLAREWGLNCELTVVNNAREAVALLEQAQADIGFLAIDPDRAEHLQFTRAYLQIEGCYLVKQDSKIQGIEQVDQAENTIVVGQSSAYDLFLSRHLQHARLLRAHSSAEVVNVFLKENANVAAGVKHQLQTDMGLRQGLRLLPGHFMLIQQAMVLHKQHGTEGLSALQAFLDLSIKKGDLQNSLRRHQVSGADLV